MVREQSFDVIKWKGNHLSLLDQTQLPLSKKYLKCYTPQDVYAAIQRLAVRGAPAIGVAAGYGVLLGVLKYKSKSAQDFIRKVDDTADYLAKSRPTAKNLFWALDRMKAAVRQSKTVPADKLLQMVLDAAESIQEDEELNCKKIGEFGGQLISAGDNILTHCNAGSLATGRYGTALAVLYEAQRKGKRITAMATETRPLLQGARLTTWELKQHGVPVTLICDNMVATCMQRGLIDRIVVGADRIASNGDTANKIGTYMIAVLAQEHKIPFYVAAPRSTFDFSLKTGKDIPIEERGQQEITNGLGRRIAPNGIKVFNPAFDVTPAKYIHAFITEYGVIRPPFLKNLKKIKKRLYETSENNCAAGRRPADWRNSFVTSS